MNSLKLVKKYIGYIKENSNSLDKVDLNEIISKTPYVGVIDEIRPLVQDKVCQWVSLGTMKIYKEKVNEVSVRMNSHNKIDVYFNNKSVNTSFAIDVEASVTYDIIGFPSGEIISLNKEKIEILMKLKLIKYLESLKLVSGHYLTNFFFFNDYRYNEILNALNLNLEPQTPNILYKNGDTVVCSGMIGKKDITEELAVVLAHNISKHGIYYYVVFKNNVLSKNPIENKFWITKDNIAGKIYQNDDNEQLSLDFQDLEEHEIDDDYHIKQIYKTKNGIKYE